LPPYAPELNPIENVWEYLRANKLAITVFDDYDHIVNKTCEAWNFFANDPYRLHHRSPLGNGQSLRPLVLAIDSRSRGSIFSGRSSF
jgi:hypothetical protein